MEFHLVFLLSFARQCSVIFDQTILQLYQDKYLLLPNEKDLEGIAKLHQYAYGFDGMFGSLDCMHTVWKNCPTGWQGSYKGKEKQCTIVLKAIADYDLGMQHMDMLEHSMARAFLPCPHFLVACWMVHLQN